MNKYLNILNFIKAFAIIDYLIIALILSCSICIYSASFFEAPFIAFMISVITLSLLILSVTIFIEYKKSNKIQSVSPTLDVEK